MIRLIRPPKPELLTKNEQSLTEQFKKDKNKKVWNKPYIKIPLSEMSFHKCCFCEIKLDEQAKNMNVEHFHYKEAYPDEVVKWDNLLPSCGQCNSNKGIHDTYNEPIINPAADDPRDYLYLKFYRIISKDTLKSSKGRLTIDLLDLNNRERLVNPRIKLADAMQCKLDDLLDKALKIESGEETRQLIITRLKNSLRDVLRMAQPDSEYSAFMATILLEDDDYNNICNIMKRLNLWTDELNTLHNCSANIKFEYHN